MRLKPLPAPVPHKANEVVNASDLFQLEDVTEEEKKRAIQNTKVVYPKRAYKTYKTIECELARANSRKQQQLRASTSTQQALNKPRITITRHKRKRDPKTMPAVQVNNSNMNLKASNVVTDCKLQRVPPLPIFSSHYAARCNTKRFPSAATPSYDPAGSSSVFSTSSVSVAGTRDTMDALQIVHKLSLANYNLHPSLHFSFSRFKVVNRAFTGSVGHRIDLNKLCREDTTSSMNFGDSSEFMGLLWKIDQNENIHVTLFADGAFNIVGFKPSVHSTHYFERVVRHIEEVCATARID